jgi:hypothetical protein
MGSKRLTSFGFRSIKGNKWTNGRYIIYNINDSWDYYYASNLSGSFKIDGYEFFVTEGNTHVIGSKNGIKFKRKIHASKFGLYFLNNKGKRLYFLPIECVDCLNNCDYCVYRMHQ